MRLRSIILTTIFSLVAFSSFSDPGDTTIVQTFTWEEQLNQPGNYKSPGRRWFEFPEDDGTTYRKILMYHTLKCFDGGLTAGGLGFPCGEWDYLSYNYLFDHTGELDSTALTHPLYLLNNQNFDNATLSTTPQMNFVRHYFQTVVSVNVENENTVQSAGDEVSSLALRTDRLRNKVQFTYTAQELVDFGLTAGWVGKLAFHAADQPGAGELMRISVAQTDVEVATWIDDPGMEVFAGAFTPQANAWFECQLTTPFEWDGSSNLTFTLELTSNNEEAPTALWGNSATSFVINNEASDRYIAFDGLDDVRLPSVALSSITDEITVAFWVNGDPNIQPAAQTCFEGTNAANQRVVNSHLPWENSRVYWDAGQSNGYDRIDKQANAVDFEGRWNHWAFTKNATTGEMRIYLNGVLWHSGNDRTRTMEGMIKFSIGAAAAGSNYYNGSIDDFSIWNKALDEATIAEWQLKYINADHPDYANLVAYYTFDEPNGTLVNDHSGNSNHATVHGNPDRRLHKARDLFLRTETIAFRPQIQITSGEYDITTETNSFDEEHPVAPQSLATYIIVGNSVELTDISFLWNHNVTTAVFNTEGEIIETIAFNGDEVSYTNTTLNYFSVPFEVVDRYEIGRYITPYGIGLTLGPDGWTWVFDVTDYEPLLHGMVELEAGNWQELLDLKFVFIEGTPPREVKRVEAFWKGQYNLSTFDQQVTDYTFTPNPDEVNFRLKTRASGHGFGQGNNCAEFCFNMHSVKVNGQTQWSWQIMEECADNPLYPQGGTWIYDRAGWCPGAKVTTQNFEVTPFVTGQESFTVDYDITYDPFGDYRMEGQLIAYGPFNFQNDVEIDEVIAPSQWKIHSRKNPICNKPVIRIRNNGEQPLTSCVFTYGINGETDTFTWTGNLPFGESAEVTLTYNNVNFHSADDQEEIALFTVTVDQPNGQTDEDPLNSTATSTFIRPPLYAYNDLNDNRLIVWINTNNAPWENSTSVETMNGTEVFARSYSQANFNHRDTIALNEGCYVFRMNDIDDDGLSFFANNDGSGSARLKRVGAGNFVQFNPNFGKEIVQHFYFKTNLVSIEEQERPVTASMTVFPNPGGEYVHVNLLNFAPQLNWVVYDLNGRMVRQGQYTSGTQQGTAGLTIPTGDLPIGLYTITVTDGVTRKSERWMKAGN